MFWLTKLVDEILAAHKGGDFVVSSGVSPSGPYHVGTLREVLTAEAIAREIRRRDRPAKHIHVSDDLDVFRKVPANLGQDYQKYLGKPLCDIPSPETGSDSYADFYLKDLPQAAQGMNLDMEIMRASQKYRAGFFTEAIEKALTDVEVIRASLEKISGRQLDDNWAPIQIIEDGYLKNRRFVSIDTDAKEITYLDQDGAQQNINYSSGQVKLNWRIDWPARWWLLGVDVEPFGRDHATKGGSYDTGAEIVSQVFGAPPPTPVPYNFINKTGQTKKMSKSAGDTITAAELLKMMPPEVVWYFMLRFPPEKQLFFDEGAALAKLIDDFAALTNKADKTEAEQQLLDISLQGISEPTISSIPFSHLVASYQAARRDSQVTLEVLARTEYKPEVEKEADTIKRELKFIDSWLDNWAPEELKFALRDSVNPGEFSDEDRQFLNDLADKVANASPEADAEWFHKAIYEFKESHNLEPKQLFEVLYRVLINKTQGPRAGWFLNDLNTWDHDWLVKRLKLEN